MRRVYDSYPRPFGCMFGIYTLETRITQHKVVQLLWKNVYGLYLENYKANFEQGPNMKGSIKPLVKLA